MNTKLVPVVATLLVLSANVNAEIQAISGTALMYDPTGLPISAPTPITGEYDTDTGEVKLWNPM